MAPEVLDELLQLIQTQVADAIVLLECGPVHVLYDRQPDISDELAGLDGVVVVVLPGLLRNSPGIRFLKPQQK